ncbi:DNA translocase FtsK 4TM domain-containing protein, partial [Candidatus Neomarinimicrobiota bacterium]
MNESHENRLDEIERMTISSAQDRRVEIFAVLLIALSIFACLSILTYNPLEEPTISEDVAIRNIMGIAGVYVSHYLVKYSLGYISIIFPIIGIMWGIWLLFKREHKAAWRLTWYGLLLAFLTAIAVGLPQAPLVWQGRGDFTAGGIVGGAASKVLFDFLGSFGAVVFLLAGYLLVISGYFRWPVRAILVRQMEQFDLWWAEWRHTQLRKGTRVESRSYAKGAPVGWRQNRAARRKAKEAKLPRFPRRTAQDPVRSSTKAHDLPTELTSR